MDTRTISVILISFIVVGNVSIPSKSQNFIISVEKDDLKPIFSEKDDDTTKEANELQDKNGDSLIPSEMMNEDVTIEKSSKENNTVIHGQVDLLTTTLVHKVSPPTNQFVENQFMSKLKHIRTRNYKIQYCPDIHFQCLNNQTCCKLPDLMGYGCCPIANAVCCIDGIHCCPAGNICDVEEGKCTTKADVDDTIFVDLKSEPERSNSNEISSAAKKHKIIRDLYSSNEAPTKIVSGGGFYGLSSQNVICPDKAYTCRDNQTCCQLPNNVGYGCCPKPNAVCCPDGWHCCPQNFICDVDHGVCRSIQPARSSSNQYSNLIQFILSKLRNILT